jgi:hypothetical protein
MATGRDVTGKRKHRSVAEQLHRSPLVIHASWLCGLAVLAGGVGSINPAGLLFLVVLFLPIVIAYRRDRLSFRIIFATLFLPAWPWAMFKATSRAPIAVG